MLLRCLLCLGSLTRALVPPCCRRCGSTTATDACDEDREPDVFGCLPDQKLTRARAANQGPHTIVGARHAVAKRAVLRHARGRAASPVTIEAACRNAISRALISLREFAGFKS